MMVKQKVVDLIINSLEELNDILDDRIIEPVNSDTRIFGRKGVLDSMGLVSLITDLEERLEDEFNISIILADDRAMSQERSPFYSVTSLADYVCLLIEEET